MLPVKLVCPRCRVADGSGMLQVRFLENTCCPGCGTRYPVVDGIHCVPPDLPAFSSSQRDWLDPQWPGMRDSLPEAIAACAHYSQKCSDLREFQEAMYPGIYATAHFPESLRGDPLFDELSGNQGLPDLICRWLSSCSPPDTGARCALEAGCGPGGLLGCAGKFARAGVVGFDLRLSALRVAGKIAAGGGYVPFRTEGNRFEPVRITSPAQDRVFLVQGDLVSPPFEAEVFPLVIAASLLDSVLDPWFVLGQLDALVCSGGLLLLATPYHWEPGVTVAKDWINGEMLRAALQGRDPSLPHLSYEIIEEEPSLPWVLAGHRRLLHRYLLDIILARKCA